MGRRRFDRTRGRVFSALALDRLERSCVSKARYSCEEDARRVGRNSLRDPGVRLRWLWPYPCQFCRGWHLTKQKIKNTIPMTKSHLREGLE